MTLRGILLAALAAVMLGAGPAAAQEADSADAMARLRGACPGKPVRVATTAGGEVLGRCQAVEDARLVVAMDGDSVRSLPLGTVEGIWVRRSGARPGAEAGMLIGGVGAGAWVLLAASALCDGGQGCGGETAVVAVGGAALGALAGRLVGGAIGGTTRRWVRLYP
ncbi:MAG TPA: hypothetical protein VLK84_32310 [Longimicrobium sp.]|nr:hypothetical protein [Longimicrobium sp.]